MGKIDLHLHTTYSDGSLSPSALVSLVKKHGVTCLAITDHDITDGIPEATEAGRSHNLKVIHGVEVNCVHNGERMEILGYFIDPKEENLNKKLSAMRDFREGRLSKILEKLAEHNIKISEKRVLEIAGKGTVGRPHIARTMLEAGYISSTDEAFEKYIGNGKPCHVERMKLSAAEAIALIKGARS